MSWLWREGSEEYELPYQPSTREELEELLAEAKRRKALEVGPPSGDLGSTIIQAGEEYAKKGLGYAKDKLEQFVYSPALKFVADAVRDPVARETYRATVPGFGALESAAGLISGGAATLGTVGDIQVTGDLSDDLDEAIERIKRNEEVIKEEALGGLPTAIEQVAPVDIVSAGAGLAAKGLSTAARIPRLARVARVGIPAARRVSTAADILEASFGVPQVVKGVEEGNPAEVGIGLFRTAAGGMGLLPESIARKELNIFGKRENISAQVEAELDRFDAELADLRRQQEGEVEDYPAAATPEVPLSQQPGVPRQLPPSGRRDESIIRIMNMYRTLTMRLAEKAARITNQPEILEFAKNRGRGITAIEGEPTQYHGKMGGKGEAARINIDIRQAAAQSRNIEEFARALRNKLLHELSHTAGLHKLARVDPETGETYFMGEDIGMQEGLRVTVPEVMAQRGVAGARARGEVQIGDEGIQYSNQGMLARDPDILKDLDAFEANIIRQPEIWEGLRGNREDVPGMQYESDLYQTPESIAQRDLDLARARNEAFGRDLARARGETGAGTPDEDVTDLGAEVPGARSPRVQVDPGEVAADRVANMLDSLARRIGKIGARLSNEPGMADLSVVRGPTTEYWGKRALGAGEKRTDQITFDVQGTANIARNKDEFADMLANYLIHELSHEAGLHIFPGTNVEGEPRFTSRTTESEYGETIVPQDWQANYFGSAAGRGRSGVVPEEWRQFETQEMLGHNPEILRIVEEFKTNLKNNPELWEALRGDRPDVAGNQYLVERTAGGVYPSTRQSSRAALQAQRAMTFGRIARGIREDTSMSNLEKSLAINRLKDQYKDLKFETRSPDEAGSPDEVRDLDAWIFEEPKKPRTPDQQRYQDRRRLINAAKRQRKGIATAEEIKLLQDAGWPTREEGLRGSPDEEDNYLPWDEEHSLDPVGALIERWKKEGVSHELNDDLENWGDISPEDALRIETEAPDLAEYMGDYVKKAAEIQRGTIAKNRKTMNAPDPNDTAAFAIQREMAFPGSSVANKRIDNMMEEAIKRVQDRMAYLTSDDRYRGLKVVQDFRGPEARFEKRNKTLYYNPFRIAQVSQTADEFAENIIDIILHEPAHTSGRHDFPTYKGVDVDLNDLPPEVVQWMRDQQFDLNDPLQKRVALMYAAEMGLMEDMPNVPGPRLTFTKQDVEVPPSWMEHAPYNLGKRASISDTEYLFYSNYKMFMQDPELRKTLQMLEDGLKRDPSIWEALNPLGALRVQIVQLLGLGPFGGPTNFPTGKRVAGKPFGEVQDLGVEGKPVSGPESRSDAVQGVQRAVQAAPPAGEAGGVGPRGKPTPEEAMSPDERPKTAEELFDEYTSETFGLPRTTEQRPPSRWEQADRMEQLKKLRGSGRPLMKSETEELRRWEEDERGSPDERKPRHYTAEEVAAMNEAEFAELMAKKQRGEATFDAIKPPEEGAAPPKAKPLSEFTFPKEPPDAVKKQFTDQGFTETINPDGSVTYSKGEKGQSFAEFMTAKFGDRQTTAKERTLARAEWNQARQEKKMLKLGEAAGIPPDKMQKLLATKESGKPEAGTLSTWRRAAMPVIENLKTVHPWFKKKFTVYLDNAETPAMKYIADSWRIKRTLSRAEKRMVIDLLEGKAQVTAKTPRNVVSAVNNYRAMLDQVWEDAVASGTRTKKDRKRRNYFPHKFTEGWDDDLVQNLYIDRNWNLRESNLEKARLSQRQDYRRDLDVLDEYFLSAYRRIAEVQTFGKRLEVLKKFAKRHVTDRVTSEWLSTNIARIMGREHPRSFERVSGHLRHVQALTDLGLAGFYQPIQATNTALYGGLGRSMRALQVLAKNYPDEVYDAIRSRALVPDITQELIQGAYGAREGIPTRAAQKFMYGIPTIDRFTRIHANTVGKLMVSDAMKGGKGAVKDIRALGFDEIKTVADLQKAIDADPEFALKVGKELSDKALFRSGAMELPGWVSSPAGKLATQYLRFMYRHSLFIRDIFKSAKEGNVRPLARFLTVAPVLITGFAEMLYPVREAIRETVRQTVEEDRYNWKDVKREALGSERQWDMEIQWHDILRNKRIPWSHPVKRALQNISMWGGIGVFQVALERILGATGDPISVGTKFLAGPFPGNIIEGTGALVKDIGSLGKDIEYGVTPFKNVRRWGVQQAPIFGYPAARRMRRELGEGRH